ncbi:hypothetical protein BDV19DRAFT_49395 [Aspergillus venezuelensis]
MPETESKSAAASSIAALASKAATVTTLRRFSRFLPSGSSRPLPRLSHPGAAPHHKHQHQPRYQILRQNQRPHL